MKKIALGHHAEDDLLNPAGCYIEMIPLSRKGALPQYPNRLLHMRQHLQQPVSWEPEKGLLQI